jgi:hypothetical protein
MNASRYSRTAIFALSVLKLSATRATAKTQISPSS